MRLTNPGIPVQIRKPTPAPAIEAPVPEKTKAPVKEPVPVEH